MVTCQSVPMIQKTRRVGKPIKTSGQLGPTKISGAPDEPIAEYQHVELPNDKEGLEAFFALPFVRAFNETRPLGDGISIDEITQNDTSDLDFRIASSAADYLELAELNPRSETFGRKAFQTGAISTHEYAHWIYSKLINKKQMSYGGTAGGNHPIIYTIHPHIGPPLPPPTAFRRLRYWNLPPGNASWLIDTTELDG